MKKNKTYYNRCIKILLYLYVLSLFVHAKNILQKIINCIWFEQEKSIEICPFHCFNPHPTFKLANFGIILDSLNSKYVLRLNFTFVYIYSFFKLEFIIYVKSRSKESLKGMDDIRNLKHPWVDLQYP